MKKIKRAAKPATRKTGKTNQKDKARGRIPVRGDASNKRKSQSQKPRGDALPARRSGVRSRELEQTPAAAAAHRDLPELRALALEAMDAALDKKALMPV